MPRKDGKCCWPDCDEQTKHTYCKPHWREWQRRHRAKNPDILRAQNLRRRFGITIDEYDGMLVGQKGVCALCGAPPDDGKRLCVDHDHTTGRVRALLCDPCNTGIGLLDDNPDLLRAAADYIEEHT